MKPEHVKSDAMQWLQILQCPACGHKPLQEAALNTISCAHCQTVYPVINGVAHLLQNQESNTQLDEAAYDTMMVVDNKSHQIVMDMWNSILAAENIVRGDALEIGCGSGLFTLPLTQMGFRSVHACDISPTFLAMTKARCPEAMLWRCDANQLPFADNSFDQIVGHSVLHHFLDYEAMLAKACCMLRPGGSLIVFEPVMQGKVLVALLANLLKQTDLHATTPVFNIEDHQKLDRLINQLSKHLQINNNREILAKMEDKYIFDVQALQRTAKQAGFHSTRYHNNPQGGGKLSIARHLKQYGIAPEKAQGYEYLSEAVRASLALLPPENQFTPMGFFVFTKLE
jgi:ubiquinone/menaquinone biosynthesis C-methylase UbiE/uncharacterized protein YbaR (Trm112 family)